MKALVGAFNQEKALVGAFSVIVQPVVEPIDRFTALIQAKYSFLREAGYGKFDTIHRADLRISDISNLLGSDWVKLARTLDIDDQDINLIISEYPDNVGQQAMVMLRLVQSLLSSYLKANSRHQNVMTQKCTFDIR